MTFCVRIANEGRMICANGLKYEGEWKDNRFDGLGSLVLPSGATYEALVVSILLYFLSLHLLRCQYFIDALLT